MDEVPVIALWQFCGLTRPWNNAMDDIHRKLTTQPELFLIGLEENVPVATAMIGFGGNRG